MTKEEQIDYLIKNSTRRTMYQISVDLGISRSCLYMWNKKLREYGLNLDSNNLKKKIDWKSIVKKHTEGEVETNELTIKKRRSYIKKSTCPICGAKVKYLAHHIEYNHTTKHVPVAVQTLQFKSESGENRISLNRSKNDGQTTGSNTAVDSNRTW